MSKGIIKIIILDVVVIALCLILAGNSEADHAGPSAGIDEILDEITSGEDELVEEAICVSREEAEAVMAFPEEDKEATLEEAEELPREEANKVPSEETDKASSEEAEETPGEEGKEASSEEGNKLHVEEADIAKVDADNKSEKSKGQLIGRWRVTEYCKKCNSGSAYQTASGEKAREWWTCAVSYENYKHLKGKVLYVEGWGKFKVMDYGSVSGTDPDKWIDLFLPDEYHNKLWEKCKVYVVD